MGVVRTPGRSVGGLVCEHGPNDEKGPGHKNARVVNTVNFGDKLAIRLLPDGGRCPNLLTLHRHRRRSVVVPWCVCVCASVCV